MDRGREWQTHPAGRLYRRCSRWAAGRRNGAGGSRPDYSFDRSDAVIAKRVHQVVQTRAGKDADTPHAGRFPDVRRLDVRRTFEGVEKAPSFIALQDPIPEAALASRCQGSEGDTGL